MKNAKLWFGSIIVIILLGLYGYSLITAMKLAWGDTGEPLPDQFSRTLTTVGGLVSALVIAKLAITKPGQSLVATYLAPEPPRWMVIAVEVISVAYVVIWILLGFAAFLVGELWFPDNVPALTDFAQAWLGLAVAAGYAYFGIERA